MKFLLIFCLTLTTALANPIRVQFNMAEGPVVIELYPDQAPIGVENFLRHLGPPSEERAQALGLRTDLSAFDQGAFFRVVDARTTRSYSILHGGVWEAYDDCIFPFVALENTNVTGLKNVEGVVGYVRFSNDPLSNGHEFFVNMKDNPLLDYGSPISFEGTSNFGRVVSGMDVLRRIQAWPLRGNFLQTQEPFREVRLLP